MPAKPRGRGAGAWRRVRAKTAALQAFQSIPDYLRDNPYIRSGYRVDWSPKDCILSLFKVHNETLNIWTHLLGFILFVTYAFTMPATDGNGATAGGRVVWTALLPSVSKVAALPETVAWWPLYVYLVGAMFCLGVSAACHTMFCVSRHVSRMIWRLDYVGIAVMISTSFFPAVYYSLTCHPGSKWLYLVGITAIAGLVTTLTMMEKFQSNGYGHVRAGLFGAMGLLGLFPFVQILLLHGRERGVQEALGLELLMAASYIGGAIVYATKWPEKLWPGTFDIVGHSHQLFHVGIVGGAYFHWQAAMRLLYWRYTEEPGRGMCFH